MEFDGDGRDQVELIKGAAGPLRALAQRTQEHFGGFGNERVAQPAVGRFAGQPQVLRTHRGHVDRDVGGPHQRPQRGAATVRQRQWVDLAGMLEPIAAADRADDLDGLAGGLHRFAKADAVPALHDAWARRADPQDEATRRQLFEAQGRRRQQRGTARTQLHDKRSESHRRRLGRQVGQAGQRVVAPDLGNPQRVDPDPLGGHCELDGARQSGFDHGADLHGWHATEADTDAGGHREGRTMRYRDLPTVEVTQRVRCDVPTAWALVTDISLPVRCSSELQASSGSMAPIAVEVGARFHGRSKHEAFGEWSTVCEVVEVEDQRRWVYNVVGPEGDQRDLGVRGRAGQRRRAGPAVGPDGTGTVGPDPGDRGATG